MCRMCVVRALKGDPYSSGFNMLSSAELAGDPFFATLAGGLISKYAPMLLSKFGKKKPISGVPTAPIVGGPVMVGGGGMLGKIFGGAAAAGAASAFRPAGAGRGIPGAGRAPRGAVAGRRRGRGITSRELRGFRKVTNLLRSVGMAPRGLGRSRGRRRPCR